MASIRDAIVDDLKTVLEALAFAGGVHIWFPTGHDGATWPAVIVASLSEDKLNESSGSPFVLAGLNVGLEVLAAPSDVDAGWKVLEALVTPIEEALAANAQWSGKAVDTLVDGFRIKPFDSDDGLLHVEIPVRIKYRHHHTSPETAP